MQEWENTGIMVESGQARINIIEIIHDLPDVLVLEIDMNSKYIRPIVASGMDTPSEVWLMAFEDALHLDESTDKQTWLLLPEATSGWSVVVDGGRYTIRIIAYRDPRLDTLD